MSGRFLDLKQSKVWLLENGRGAPLLYLHGFVDVHSVKDSWMPFHDSLAARARVIAPAHPGCSQSDENKDVEAIEDVVFHYLEFLDALNLPQFDLVGSCVGGWIAAELAARHPEKIRKMVLIGAAGLFVQGALIGDVFMMAQPERGSSYAGLRQIFSRVTITQKRWAFFPMAWVRLKTSCVAIRCCASARVSASNRPTSIIGRCATAYIGSLRPP